MKFLVIATVLAVASARPQREREAYTEEVSRSQDRNIDDRRFNTTTVIPILQWNKQQDIDGTYKTNYETGNNINAEESGYIKSLQGSDGEMYPSLVQEGSYSYESPDGTLIQTRYIANENGFQVFGDHLPTPPPVSEEIQKGLDLIYEGIRLQKEAAEREAASKPAQQISAQSLDRQRDNKENNYRQ